MVKPLSDFDLQMRFMKTVNWWWEAQGECQGEENYAELFLVFFQEHPVMTQWQFDYFTSIAKFFCGDRLRIEEDHGTN